MQRVGVENSLIGAIGKALATSGYQVVNLDPASKSMVEYTNCDAYVISGMDRNFLGQSEITSQAPVIDATGMDSDQVLDTLQSRLALQ